MISVNRSALIEALNRCAKVTPAKSPQAILQHACISVINARLMYRATDLTTGVSGYIDCAGEDASFSVNPKELASVLSVLTGDLATITPGEGLITVKATGKRSFKVRTLPGSDFPRHQTAEGESFTVPAAQVLALLRSVIFAVHTDADDNQAFLKCIRLLGTGEVMSAAATDGRKAAICSTPGDGSVSVLVPEQAARFLLDNVDAQSPLNVAFDARTIEFCWGQDSISTRIPGGQLPPIEQIFERPLSGSFEVATAVLSESVSAVQRIDAKRDVLLTMTSGQLKVEAFGEGAGHGQDEIQVECSREGQLACSAEALLAALKSCGERVTVSYGDDLDPMKLSSDGFEAIIMPIRLDYLKDRKK